jgi:hypothetical protein
LHSAPRIQQALIASLLKLEKSNHATGEELQWLRGSIMRMVAEFSVLQEHKKDSMDPAETRTTAA